MQFRYAAICLWVVSCAPTTAPQAPLASISNSAANPTAATLPPQSPDPAVLDEARKAVKAPDRSDEDRLLDAGRMPAETLAFFGVKRGARVLDLGVGRGYTTELIARIV